MVTERAVAAAGAQRRDAVGAARAWPSGHVLEIGAGSGAMAAELLATHPDIAMTVTDDDPAMVDAATVRLRPFGERVPVRVADATSLPFPDGSFDGVVSWIMLHHTLEWEKALAGAVRVVRPGGEVVGYDLLSTAPLRLLHQAERARFRMIRFHELRDKGEGAPGGAGRAHTEPCRTGGSVPAADADRARRHPMTNTAAATTRATRLVQMLTRRPRISLAVRSGVLRPTGGRGRSRRRRG